MKIRKKIHWYLFAIIAFYGCSTLEDTYSDFTSEPEKIYIGAADSIFYQSGLNKARIFILYNSDPKISKGNLVSQDGTINQPFDIVRTKGGQDTTFVDVELEEGTYRFNVNLLDKNNNSSLTKEILVNVLGENYLKTLSSRKIEDISFVKSENPEETGAQLTFGKLYADLKYAKLYYTNSSGEEQTVIIDGESEKFLINDFESSSKIKLESYYEPENPFNDFIAPDVQMDTLPDCNSLQWATPDAASVEFDSLSTGEVAIKKIIITPPECILGSLNLSTTEPFGLATSEEGPFEDNISLDPGTQDIYIAFTPITTLDSLHKASITVSAINVLDSPIVELQGIERGVILGGLQRHPVEMRSLASSTFTDDLNVLNYGTSIGNLWDGGFRWPSAIHSVPDLPVPAGFFTIDLGDDFKLREIDWMLRADCCYERANHKYQYWGLPSKVDPASAITSVEFNGQPQNQTKWEEEMFSKGWINLGNFEKSQAEVDEALNSGIIMSDPIEVVNYVRYVRVVILETFEGETATVNFSELDFQVEIQ